MKAVVFTRYGSPDVLELKEVATPSPRDDEVLVKVHAASVNDWDYEALRGKPFVNRLMFGLFRPKKQILGSDIAGRVEAVGARVTRFRPGDEVFGDLSGRWGGFAEYACAPEQILALKSAGMSFEQAAAIPQAGMLALQGLRDSGRIRPGQRVLINGAGGGAGTFAIQIARSLGAEVVAVDSAGKLDLMRSLGAARVIDYTQTDFTTTGEQYDLILDIKTRRSILECARALRPGGRYVTMGGSMPRLLQMLLLIPWIVMTSSKRVAIVALKPNGDLAYLKELFEAGRLRPILDGPFKLSEVPQAMRRFAEGRHRGKVVISIVPTRLGPSS
jgi:NADPH:quinone reductase-like Zn-dependent oxidoreductase